MNDGFAGGAMTRKTVYAVLALLVLVGGGLFFRAMRRRQPIPVVPSSPLTLQEQRAGTPVVRGEVAVETGDDRQALQTDSTPLADSPTVPGASVPPGVAKSEADVRPPWMQEDGSVVGESRRDSGIRRLAQEITQGSGPFSAEQARGLLAADQAGLGVVGAAVMLSQPDWDAELMRLVAAHDDPAVPLFAMQALADAGRTDEANALREQLRERLAGIDDWASLVQVGGLPGTVARGLMNLASELASEQDRTSLAVALVSDDALDYGGRMRAMLELRDLLPFEDYRAAVRSEYSQADDNDDPVWQEGIKRLAERLEGPVVVHTGTPYMTPSDVDVMVAREYPAMYEDLTLRLEMLAADEAAVIGEGVKDKLQDVIKTATAYPLSDSEAAALQRLSALVPDIIERDASALAPPPPPGQG